jgi:hypothetical protein
MYRDTAMDDLQQIIDDGYPSYYVEEAETRHDAAGGGVAPPEPLAAATPLVFDLTVSDDEEIHPKNARPDVATSHQKAGILSEAGPVRVHPSPTSTPGGVMNRRHQSSTISTTPRAGFKTTGLDDLSDQSSELSYCPHRTTGVAQAAKVSGKTKPMKKKQCVNSNSDTSSSGLPVTNSHRGPTFTSTVKSPPSTFNTSTSSRLTFSGRSIWNSAVPVSQSTPMSGRAHTSPSHTSQGSCATVINPHDIFVSVFGCNIGWSQSLYTEGHIPPKKYIEIFSSCISVLSSADDSGLVFPPLAKSSLVEDELLIAFNKRFLQLFPDGQGAGTSDYKNVFSEVFETLHGYKPVLN